MDNSDIKEIISAIDKIKSHPRVEQELEEIIGIKHMDDVKTETIDLDQKYFELSLTLTYTLIIQLLSITLCVIAQQAYITFINPNNFDSISNILIKVIVIIFFVLLFMIIMWKQYMLLGRRTGELIALVNNYKEMDYHYKGYAYLFKNSVLTFLSTLILLVTYLFLKYIAPTICLLTLSMYGIIICINLLFMLQHKYKNRYNKFKIKIARNDNIVIYLSNNTNISYHLYEEFYRLSYIRIKYNNDIYIYIKSHYVNNDKISRKCEVFDCTTISKITIGSTTLKYNTQHNKWEIQPPTLILIGSNN